MRSDQSVRELTHSLELQEDFKQVCRNLTHKILEKEERNNYDISQFSADKVKKFMDDYLEKKGKKKKKKT